MNSYGNAGLGVGFVILMIVIYLALIALGIWIQYLIMRTAVKNGMKLAMQETGQQFPPAGYRPAMPPQGPQPPQPPYQAPPTA